MCYWLECTRRKIYCSCNGMYIIHPFDWFRKSYLTIVQYFLFLWILVSIFCIKAGCCSRINRQLFFVLCGVTQFGHNIDTCPTWLQLCYKKKWEFKVERLDRLGHGCTFVREISNKFQRKKTELENEEGNLIHLSNFNLWWL